MNDIPAFPAALGGETAPFSRPAPTHSPVPSHGRVAPAWRRPKLLAALALVGISAFGLIRHQVMLASELAVVSAPRVTLRAPIGGVVQSLSAPLGEPIAAGATVARIRDDRAAAEAAGLAAELAARDAVAASLARRAAEAPSPYLEQRADEVALRRAGLLRQQAAALPAEAELAAGGTWQLWRILAAPGQRVARDAPVADFVACGEAELLAVLAQREVPQVSPGQPVSVRLHGELAYRPGTVLGWLPEGMAQEGGGLAALPPRPRDPSRVLRIALDGAATECAIGRSARVVFDARAHRP